MAVEQALDVREAKLKDSWQLLRERGAHQSGANVLDSAPRAPVLAMLMEDASAAAAQVGLRRAKKPLISPLTTGDPRAPNLENK
eukprot:295609-Prorocentrum_minimum.AAC.2